MTLGSLWNHYRDEINDSANENNDVNNFRVNNKKAVESKSFKYKNKVIGGTTNHDYIIEAEVIVPLKYLCNFWRSLNLPLINCTIELLVCHGQHIV